MTETEALSQSVEEYLLAIERLGHMPRGVSTTKLARHLRVRPASVTGMLRRLTGLGLITYRRYRDIALTPAGEHRARDLIRRHRLTERFLSDLVGVPLEDVHQEACRLEHAVSPDLEKRIERKLGAPDACPHGHPMDASARDRTVTLADAPLNQTLTIVSLQDESPEVIRYLADRKLLPGAQVQLKLREPLGGAAVLAVGGATETIGPGLAAGIRVRTSRRRR